MISKENYISIFTGHIGECLVLAERKDQTTLPKNVRCILGTPELYENALSAGSVKYLGGRMLTPDKIKNLPVNEAAKFTYIDGKVPIWVNLYFEGSDKDYSYIRVVTSKDISGDESKLYVMPEGKKQFRIILSKLEG